MNKRKILALAMALSMVAILAVGATLAYFTDIDSATNTFTVGNVDIIQNEKQRKVDENGKPTAELETFVDAQLIVPAVGTYAYAPLADCPTENGYNKDAVHATWSAYTVFADTFKNVHDKFVTVTNNGQNDAYVRTIIIIENPFDRAVEDYIGISWNAGYSDDINSISEAEEIPFNNGEYIAYVLTYEKPVKAGDTTVPSLRQVYLDATATNEIAADFGPTLDVYAISQAVQADGFEDATTALDAGHGKIDAAKLSALFADVLAD